MKVVTDESGVFHVLALQPGTYRVRVELGVQDRGRRRSTVVSGRTTTIAVRLRGRRPGRKRCRVVRRPVESAGRRRSQVRRAEADPGSTARPTATCRRPASIASARIRGRRSRPTSTRRPTPTSGGCSAKGACRPKARSASRSSSTTSASTTRRRTATRRSRSRPKSARVRGTRITCWPWSACGPRTSRMRERDAADAVRGRNLVFLVDVSGSMSQRRQAAAGASEPAPADRSPRRRRSHRAGRLRRQQRPGPAVDVGRGQSRHPRRHRPPRVGRQHQRRGRHQAGLPDRAPSSSSPAASTA